MTQLTWKFVVYDRIQVAQLWQRNPAAGIVSCKKYKWHVSFGSAVINALVLRALRECRQC